MTVSCGKGVKRKATKKIQKSGLYNTGPGLYSGIVSARKLRYLSAVCKANGMSLRINNTLGTRGKDYRQIFFRYNKPISGKYYLCAYCGKKLLKKMSTVDHIIPIARAAKSLSVQKSLFRMGISDINDPRNLVAACSRCNKKKGTKMGLWTVRGFAGKIPFIRKTLNFIKACVKTAVFVIFVYILYRFYLFA